MTTFQVTDALTVTCKCQQTRTGFRHVAELRAHGAVVAKAMVRYQNRTWESFEFQRVVARLAASSDVSPAVRETLYAFLATYHAPPDPMFKAVTMVAALGDVFAGDSLADKNAWKLRMLKAGLTSRGLDVPDDFDGLDEEEKARRLDGILAILKEAS
jgi:hypothetical protein